MHLECEEVIHFRAVECFGLNVLQKSLFVAVVKTYFQLSPTLALQVSVRLSPAKYFFGTTPRYVNK